MPKPKTDNPADNKVGLGSMGGINFDDIGETPTTESDTEKATDLNAFFEGLDKQFNGAIFSDEPVEKAEPQSDDSTFESKPTISTDDEVAKVKKELDEVKTRYSDSSREAKRLADENKQLKQYADYIPILETMREDPGLINHVRNYLEGNSTPASIADEMKLPEDFVFDSDEAVRNSNSQSAQVLQRMIDKGVEKQLSQYRENINQERARESTLDRFREESKMTDDEYQEFVEYAQNTKLTLKDIYYLKTREKRESEIAKRAIEERDKKMVEMRNTPRSVAALGTSSEGVSDERKVFNAIAKAHSGARIFNEVE